MRDYSERLSEQETKELTQMLYKKFQKPETIDKIKSLLKNNKRIEIESNILQPLIVRILNDHSNGITSAEFCDLIFQSIDLSGIRFDGLDVTNLDLSVTNAKIDPQTLKNKSLFGCKIKSENLLNKTISGGVNIIYAEIEGEDIEVVLQEIDKKSLYNCKLKKVKLTTDCDGIDMRGTALEEVEMEVDLDPQKLRLNSLSHCKIKGVDLSNANLDDVDIEGADLSETNAVINVNTIKNGIDGLKETQLEGCTIYNCPQDLKEEFLLSTENVTFKESAYEKGQQMIKTLFS